MHGWGVGVENQKCVEGTILQSKCCYAYFLFLAVCLRQVYWGQCDKKEGARSRVDNLS